MGNEPDLRRIILMFFVLLLQPILLMGTDPRSSHVMGFRIKIFPKQFVCLLFPVCLLLVENMIAGIQVLLACITSGKMSVNFIVDFLMLGGTNSGLGIITVFRFS